MPSVVQRNSNKAGLVLLESQVSVGNDGLVTVAARFLAPAAGGNVAQAFANDSPWPFTDPPTGLPLLQGPPSLNTYSAQKQNGLTFISATYVSALNPVRVAISTATERLSFSGYAEQSAASALGTAAASGSLSFDYYTRTMTATYTLIAPNAFNATVAGQIGARFNVRKEGFSDLVTTSEQEFLTESVEQIGRVSRVTRTARRIIVQGETPEIKINAFQGATLNGVPLFNPWQGPRIL